MDLGDHRLGQAHDRLHHLAAASKHRLVDLPLGLAADFLEIVAGAEPGPRSRQDHDLDRRIAGQRRQRLDHLAHQGHGEGIARLRPVQGQGGDAIVILAQQDRLVAMVDHRENLVLMAVAREMAMMGAGRNRCPAVLR